MTLWPATSNLLVWSIISFSLYNYYKFASKIVYTCDIPTLFCFLIQDDNQVRFRRLMETFSDPMTEVYLLFFQATIPTFTSFNLLLQREQSSIFLLHDEVHWEGGICFCCCVLFLFGVICCELVQVSPTVLHP